MKNTDRPTSPITANVRTALHTAPDKPPGTPLRSHRRVGAHRVTHLAIASLLGLSLAACGGQAVSGHEPHAGTPPSDTDTLRPGAPNISGNTPSTPSPPNTPDTTGRTPAPAAPGNTPDKAGLDPAALCAAELAAMPPLPAGTERRPLPDNARPPFLSSTLDPVHGSCIVRVTDNAAHPEAPARRNDYSRRQAFNANDTYFLLAASDGHWHLHDATTGRFIRVLNNLNGATDRLAGDAEPQWHPTDPDLLYFLPRDGIGMQIYQLDLRTNQVSVVADMGPQIQQHWPDASVASTRSEGSPSADGRYWCFMARAMVDNGSWPMRGVFTWDLQEQRIVGTLNQDGTPDHVSMSPSGKYCVVSHTTATGPGTRSYRRDFQAPYSDSTPDSWLQLHTTSEHSDIALDPQGRDVYVSVDYQSNGGDVFMQNLETGQRTPLFSTYPGRTATALHISGKAYNRPGWVLVSTYAEHPADDSSVQGLHDERRQWLHRKMFAVSLTGNPDIRSIAYINSDAFKYEAEPQATVNRNFTRMLFNSTWNGSSMADQEVFLTAITAQALDSR